MRRRGPSFASGVGSIFAAIFGVFWTITAATMGAFIMIPFGLLFIGFDVFGAIYNFKGSKNKNSTYDDKYYKTKHNHFEDRYGDEASEYDFNVECNTENCPYCDKEVRKDFIYCPYCGSRLPR